jgi:hypothetical protein
MASNNASLAKQPERYWPYAVWSVCSLLALFLLPSFWHSPHHGRGHYDVAAPVLVIGVAAICSWAFVRCPFRHWFVKSVTFISLLVALFYVVLVSWICAST